MLGHLSLPLGGAGPGGDPKRASLRGQYNKRGNSALFHKSFLDLTDTAENA